MKRKCLWFALFSSLTATAQTTVPLPSTPSAAIKIHSEAHGAAMDGLPSAPVAQTGTAPATTQSSTQGGTPLPENSPVSSPGDLPTAPAQTVPNPGPTANTPGARTLTIRDAEQIALKNNPQISVARLTALASQQVTRETRSALWPTAAVDLTGVDSNDARIAAGNLNNPIV